MRIQHNIMAMNAYRNYTNNTSALSKNLEKLSSGYKINRAGDDAAGLAISEKMRAQITSLSTAQKNAKDGISLVQTAEGALTEVHDMLNRMVELAQQSANGTYDDGVDRANLQKEFDALRSEIDRIADSSNFNGIKLLNGDMSKTEAINSTLAATGIAEVKSDTIALTAMNDGVKTPPTSGQDYGAKFYVGDISNSNTAAASITISYKDNAGAAQTVTISIGAASGADKATLTNTNIAAALSGATTAGNAVSVSGSIAVTATDSAAAGTGGGSFSDLYEVKIDGNMLVVTAKAHNSTVTGVGNVDGSKLGSITISTSGFTAGDMEAASHALKQDPTAANAAPIPFGKLDHEQKYIAETDGGYERASVKMDFADKTGEDLHNVGFTVGDNTYIFQVEGEDLSSDAQTEVDGGAQVIKVKADTTAASAAQLLSDKIFTAEGANTATANFVATVSGGTVTISESTNRAEDIKDDPDKVATKAKDLVTFKEFTVTAGQTGLVNGTISLDLNKLANGTKLTVGDKTYMFTNDDTLANPDGHTLVEYDVTDTAEDIANKLMTKMAANGATGYSVGTNGTITFTNGKLDSAGTQSVQISSSGLNLQIGESSEAFNQLKVSVQDMHVTTLGIGNDVINIDNQLNAQAAVDKIKTAINTVSSVRGDLGATQNRLEHTINNLSVMEENIQDAESTIRDVDVAKEMMAYTKNNILVQSAQAMLAQANQVPQGVLQLLQ